MSLTNRESIRVACIQLNSGSDHAANLLRVSALMAEAGEQHCDLILLPENFSFMGANDAERRAVAERAEDSPTLTLLSELARKYKAVIVGGSLPLKSNNSHKIRNSCPVFSTDGTLIACYDKIHLFDATLPDKQYVESDRAEPGSQPVTASFDGWKIGLSICYDLRFPELYRHYSSIGCNILTVPAAFTVPTGEAHWEVLLRTRAIENQAYLLAAGQCGIHPGVRKTWGHSMIVDPWGEVLATLDNKEGIITAELSLNKLNEIRQAMPVLSHRRI